MIMSHSRVDSYKQCPYKFKLRYIDELQTLPNTEPSNALIIGTALHMGIEQDVKTAIDWYYNQFPVITDEHITEAMKLEKVIPMMKAKLPVGGEFEVKIKDEDFVGYIDYLVPVESFKFDMKKPIQLVNGVGFVACPDTEYEWFDIYDFKYSNNIDRYLESGQLHEYKYYFEKNNPNKKIRNLYFIFAPKCQLKQKYKNKTNKFDEDIQAFRRRCMEWIDNNEVVVEKVEYNPNKVIEFTTGFKHVLEEKEYKKEPSKLCYFCEYRSFCEQGLDYEIIGGNDMNLPSTERRDITKNNYKKLWIYGAPFSGKTTFVDKAPNPLNLNTDGNIKYVTMPYIAIRDEVKVEGRQTITTLAWQLFKDTIFELQKKENDFETIVVDLLEDTYEYCRLFMYDQLGITHESDDSFRAWDKVRTEFLSTIKKLLNLDYNIVLISHEDTSKDIMKKGGDKITAIKPNINDKVANKIAGMVDIVGRVIADGDIRTLSFKTDEVVFGGGRLQLDKKDIPLDWNDLMKVYGINTPAVNDTQDVSNSETVVENVENHVENVEEEKPTRTRRARKVEEVEEVSTEGQVGTVKTVMVDMSQIPVDEAPTEEQPVRKTRRKRGE